MLQKRIQSITISLCIHTLWNLLIRIKILVHIHGKINHVCVTEKIQLSLQHLWFIINLQQQKWNQLRPFCREKTVSRQSHSTSGGVQIHAHLWLVAKTTLLLNSGVVPSEGRELDRIVLNFWPSEICWKIFNLFRVEKFSSKNAKFRTENTHV